MNWDLIKTWIKDTIIRTIKTGAETALATIGACAFISDVNWIAVLSATALSMIITILMNIASYPVDKK